VFGRTLNPDPKFPDARPAGSDPLGRMPASTPSGPIPGKQASVIGPDLTIIGQKIILVCKSTLIVTGEIVGDINGSEVTVGDTGKVTGTITARNIAVHGEVKGALKAETVTLHATAHIDGDIVQKNLVIAEGAQFDGRVRAAKDPSEFEPEFDAARLTSATTTP
jgi:cytoskeletal protein CcmA (bactofilin family)